MKPVRISVPASTANLGPGFDCLALALELRNTVEMQTADEGLRVDVEGEGANELPRDPANLILKAAFRVFDFTGRRPAGLRMRAFNRIPLGSGLGSSAAAIAGGMAAADALMEAGLSSDELLRLAYGLEGHADNLAAALFGGLVLVSAGPASLLARQIPVADLKVAVALPALRLSTPEMRRALPGEVPLSDAVFNLGRALLTAEALRAGDYSLLERAMADRLHQPYRSRFIPGYDAAVAAAREAGARALALSGAGPSLVAFAPEGHEAIARAMAGAFEKAGLATRTFVLAVDHQGIRGV